jgi:signal transduction histidine kinase
MEQAISTLVIHDIKNSLALLEADLEQLNHHPGMPEEAHKAYQRCIELKGRLINFLTLYKHEHAGLKPNLSEVELSEFLEDLIADSPSVALGGKHGRSVAVALAEDKVRIASGVRHKGEAVLDAYLVDVALESALNNAVRYAASKVDVWFEQEADKVRFFIQDDGPGPDAPSAAPAGKPASTGLGLALCNAVTAAHGGGNVTLSPAPAGGALFMLELHSAE